MLSGGKCCLFTISFERYSRSLSHIFEPLSICPVISDIHFCGCLDFKHVVIFNVVSSSFHELFVGTVNSDVNQSVSPSGLLLLVS